MKPLFLFSEKNGQYRIKTPAKINLYFEILGKRSGGFHEIESIIAPIDLYDELILDPRESRSGKITLRIAEDPTGSLPADERNLIVKAANLLRSESGRSDLSDLAITLNKRIPVEAGLGGGSSDAAAVLFALNRIWKLDLNQKDLIKLGARLGSDIPLFFASGPVLCRGRGEILSPFAAPKMILLLFKPPRGLSTREVYDLSDQLPSSDRRSVQAILNDPSLLMRGGLFNRLEKAAEILYPDLRDFKDILRGPKIEQILMSGSGSALFALCPDEETAHEKKRNLDQKYPGSAFIVRNLVPDSGELLKEDS
ncbi:MAG: 4-(cytidine 5'-diphospho)-2-C-methyl-D-erythritol kinase [Planctomycetia bacterium]|nr:4-(cytidine 5'-diphospho)-2-C-methyl-D-erythritol kinase [Planctomycetia bacterium]